jgi:hypothetical protein
MNNIRDALTRAGYVRTPALDVTPEDYDRIMQIATRHLPMVRAIRNAARKRDEVVDKPARPDTHAVRNALPVDQIRRTRLRRDPAGD